MSNMNFELKTGRRKVSFSLPEENFSGILRPASIIAGEKFDEEIRGALENPIGTSALREIVKPGEKIAVITSDITRPLPSHLLLPPVIAEIKKGGVPEADITIVFALGSHRKHTEKEKELLAGSEIYHSDISIIDSDMDDCVNLGICRNGTPVDIFRPVAQADRRICLGNIEYHYFAGFSGGAKAVMPGVSSRAAIQANHSNMIKDEATAGRLDENPVRQDIDEAGEKLGIDFIVNVVLNPEKQIIKVFAGHFMKAHRIGCAFLDDHYGVKIKRQADIVIASSGGFPKDINLYQAQKGLDNSKYAVKDGGTIILTAAASEGFGEDLFEQWMLQKSPDEMINEIQENFRLGAHKAAAIAGILKKIKIYWISDMPDSVVREMGFTPFSTVQDALDSAIERTGPGAEVLIMPDAGMTLPVIENSRPQQGG